MKKYLCFLLAGLLLLSMTACGAPKNPDESEATQESTEVSNVITGTNHTYNLTQAEDDPHTKILTVMDGDKEVQVLRLEETDWFIERPIFMDITFDGCTDILAPIQRAASGVFFAGYVWDAKTQQYVHVPSLDYLPNIVVDKANSAILFCRTTSRITNYGMYQFNPEKLDFEYVRSLYWEPSESGLIVAEKQYTNGKETLLKYFTAATTDGIMPSKNDANMAPYYADGSLWDLDSEKWNNTLYKP